MQIHFEGLGGEPADGVIRAIRPRAEVRDGENVFVAEVEIDNPDLALRPGMHAVSKIETGKKRVAWILFHHAAERVLAWW